MKSVINLANVRIMKEKRIILEILKCKKLLDLRKITQKLNYRIYV